MGKGKLKESLHNKKVTEKAEKIKQKNESKQKEKSEAESKGPKTVSKEDLEAKQAAEQAKAEAKAAAEQEEKELKEKEAKEYQSNSLSKKDRRKLKKAIEGKLAQEEAEAEAEAEDEEEEEEEEEESNIEIAEDDDSEMEEYLLDLEKLARSDDEDEDEEEEDDDEEEEEEEEDEEEVDEEELEEEEDIALSDVEIDSDADIVPHSKLTINNVAALNNALKRIELPWAKYSFQEHQSITSENKVEPQIKDIYDDTERELAFYKQALDATLQGRAKLLKLKVPFTRPDDYFAEMIKSDEHMDKLKSKLIKEASEKKAAVEARRQRDLKKFGKQVQNQTLQQRAKDKKETLDKIKSLKRKRQNDEITGDAFDIALEEATADQEERKDKRAKPNSKRMAKNSKYGQGGMKRFKRKNDAESSADVSDFSHRKMKGKASKRPGKSKRARR